MSKTLWSFEGKYSETVVGLELFVLLGFCPILLCFNFCRVKNIFISSRWLFDMDILEINRLRVHTEVGCSPNELGKKRKIIITIHVRISTKRAGETDRVEDTIDYRTITKDVLFHVENKRYNLIEAVATDVARICVVRHGVPSVKVIVEKPNAVTFSESSIVTIERRWEDFEWHEAHISIGSNIEPEKNLSMAMDLLKEHMEVLKVSKASKTTPVGDKKQADFLNMAALVKTKLGPAG